MKKNLLITACLFLGLASQALSAEVPTAPTNTEIEQKACQNVFSFINIDLSLMSPRATGADIKISDVKPADTKSGPIVPISNRLEQPQQPQPSQPLAPQKSKTSLFRLDLLHIFKIQVL